MTAYIGLDILAPEQCRAAIVGLIRSAHICRNQADVDCARMRGAAEAWMRRDWGEMAEACICTTRERVQRKEGNENEGGAIDC